MEELIKNVIAWAEGRGIYEKSTAEKQYELYLEETAEFYEALKSGNRDDIIMEYGDRVVTMINHFTIWFEGEPIQKIYNSVIDFFYIGGEYNLRSYNNFTIEQALEAAYNKISSRAGKMVDGKFTKQEDL